jgi:hypothetical protein
VAPCNARLDPRYAYRVSGEGLVPSRPFTLPQDKEHLVVDASMGSAYGRVGGLMLTAGGIGGLLLGGAALVASPILESQNLGSQTLRTSVLSAGVGLVGLGAIALGTGLWLWLSNDTKVNLEPSAAAKCPPHVRMTPTGFVF